MTPVAIAKKEKTFGKVSGLSAFIRQLKVNQEINLNDKAKHKALEKNSIQLDMLRKHLQSNKYFDSHFLEVYGVAKNISPNQFAVEKKARENIKMLEESINNPFASVNEYLRQECIEI